MAFLLGGSGEDGLAADDGRLVQWWFWYSLYDTVGDYGASDLYDPDTGTLTELGQVWSEFIRANQP